MSWDNWIKNNTVDKNYDRLLELAVSSYNLDERTRKMDQKDRVQFIIKWWLKNKKKFKKYTNTEKIAGLLKIKHSTVVHHYTYRKKSRIYEEETRCIKDFIES
jgi:hypothetical protein